MPTSEELTELVQAVAADGDRQAYAALFQHFAPRVKAYLMRAGTPVEIAEELAQDAMVAVWRKAAAFDPARAQLSTWIFTIARNLRIDHLRRHGDEQADREPGEVDLDAYSDSADVSVDDQVSGLQCETAVRGALAKLPAEQALVLHMSFYDDEPHARIAEALRIPLGTVKSRIRLAIVHLRRLLDGFES